ncbi:MAG: hypothetical protein EXR86_13935 [Gammaproteobacteria bacterium]|nr:hypothetical protein [Gammaproteobacteria bacterium]
MGYDDISTIVGRNNQSGRSNDLLICLIWKESSFDPLARSEPDARGLMARGLTQMRRGASHDIRRNYRDLLRYRTKRKRRFNIFGAADRLDKRRYRFWVRRIWP